LDSTASAHASVITQNRPVMITDDHNWPVLR